MLYSIKGYILTRSRTLFFVDLFIYSERTVHTLAPLVVLENMNMFRSFAYCYNGQEVGRRNNVRKCLELPGWRKRMMHYYAVLVQW